MPTADYYFSSIKLDPIVIPSHSENNDTVSTKQQQSEDPIPEDPSPPRPGETWVYPSAIATNKTPVLDLTNTTVTSELDCVQHSIHWIYVHWKHKETHMADKNPSPNKLQLHHISDSDTSDEESNPHLHTSVKERHYKTIPGSAQARQAALSHTRAQTNPTIERTTKTAQN